MSGEEHLPSRNFRPSQRVMGLSGMIVAAIGLCGWVLYRAGIPGFQDARLFQLFFTPTLMFGDAQLWLRPDLSGLQNSWNVKLVGLILFFLPAYFFVQTLIDIIAE